MHKRTKSLAISAETKRAVQERDGCCCVICGRSGNPEAHYISRAQGGLGIEENIVTLCRDCHRRYDHTTDRAVFRAILRDYLKSKYVNWSEDDLTYRKGL